MFIIIGALNICSNKASMGPLGLARLSTTEFGFLMSYQNKGSNCSKEMLFH